MVKTDRHILLIWNFNSVSFYVNAQNDEDMENKTR